MSRIATFYVLEIKDLEQLQGAATANAGGKKKIFSLKKKGPDPIENKLDEIALEKIPYRWSGFAYTLLSVFSREKMGFDWSQLEYRTPAQELSEKYEAGIYIFSIKDEGLFRMQPTGLFYTLEELNQFAVELKGNEPANPNIMNDAVKLLNEVLSKLTKERIVLLLLR